MLPTVEQSAGKTKIGHSHERPTFQRKDAEVQRGRESNLAALLLCTFAFFFLI
jgi:hypothetical protein